MLRNRNATEQQVRCKLDKLSKSTKNNHLKMTDDKKSQIKDFIKNLSEEQKLKFWIKTMLSSYNIFPELIKTLDKIIELQASSISFASNIYNSESTTLNQVERVIDLSERKNHLLNLHIMTKEMIRTMKSNDFYLLEKRYIYNWNAEDLAREFEVSTRTIYRKIDKLINDIFIHLKSKNWSNKFIESQIKNEFWLKERFIKFSSEYFKNSNYQRTY